MKLRLKRYSRRTVYRNDWLNLHVDRVKLPAGRIIDHHFIEFPRESAAAVVEDPRGRVLMVRAYRYVIGAVEWELPAGNFERSESPLEGARREVLEETGYETIGHRLIYTFHPISGVSDKVFHVVRCRAGRKAAGFDKNEVKGHRWFTPAQLKSLIKKNRIKDGYALAALLLHFSGLAPKIR